MNRKFSLLLLFFISGNFLFGQARYSLTGSVNNSRNEPVSGASVYLLNTGMGTTSDTRGKFRLEGIPAGIYTAEITAIGYGSLQQEIILPATGNILIVLTPSAQVLDDIVVSAQKKEESMQQAALSLSALNSRRVEEYRLWNSRELTAIVPNLYSNHSGDDRNVTSIRGITTTSYDQAVATYIDGVNQFSLDTYIPNLFDVERIEVLRGPQGTLYGRNAMGGVINIITRQPGNQSSGYVDLSFGNYGLLQMNDGFRLPLIKNKLYLGFAQFYSQRNGYYHNDFNNHSYDDQKTATGNYYLKYVPGRNWAITLNAKHRNTRNKGSFPLVFGVDEAFMNPFKLNQNALATMIDNTLNTSLSVTHNGQLVNFSSQTAYQSNRRIYNNPLDADFSPIDGITIINNYEKPWNKVKVWTQEFRLQSAPSAGYRMQWTAGAYFFLQDNPNKQATHFGEDAGLLGLPDKNFSLINTGKGKSSGAAFYGQGTWPVSRHLEFTAGIRYDYEAKELMVNGLYQPDNGGGFPTRTDTSARVNFSAFSPKLALAWHINPRQQVYVVYSRGYRTGGLTQLSSDPSSPPLFPYKPEYSNNFEAGIKNVFLQNRLRLNAVVFYTLLTDAQLPTLILPDAITIIRNGGKMDSRGAELELAATAAKGLEIAYNAGFTDASFRSGKISLNGSEADLKGKKQVFTPSATSQLAIQYSYEIIPRHSIRLVLRGEWALLGEQYFDLANTIRQKGYSLFHSRAGLSARNWEIMGWMRNIGNKKYIAYAYDFGAVHLGDPQTFGVSLKGRF